MPTGVDFSFSPCTGSLAASASKVKPLWHAMIPFWAMSFMKQALECLCITTVTDYAYVLIPNLVFDCLCSVTSNSQKMLDKLERKDKRRGAKGRLLAPYNITLRYVTLRFISFRFITSRRNVTLCNITLHHITSHYITSHYITYSTSHHLHHITSHYITLHRITLYHLQHITSHYITLHHITLLCCMGA